LSSLFKKGPSKGLSLKPKSFENLSSDTTNVLKVSVQQQSEESRNLMPNKNNFLEYGELSNYWYGSVWIW
jgi:hypothetical protein